MAFASDGIAAGRRAACPAWQLACAAPAAPWPCACPACACPVWAPPCRAWQAAWEVSVGFGIARLRWLADREMEPPVTGGSRDDLTDRLPRQGYAAAGTFSGGGAGW